MKKNKGGLSILIKRIFLILLLASTGFFCTRMLSIWRVNYVEATGLSQIIINELAWMGTEVSSSDEWIELKNLTDQAVNLESWVLIAEDGSPNINLSGDIAANSYFLLERTDDNSAIGITADLIYSGALGNSGEILELRDSEGNLVDTIVAGDGWLAGDNASKQTMERLNNGSWQTSQIAGGTPKAANSIISNEDNENDEQEQEDNGREDKNQEGPFPGEQEADVKYKLGDIVINEFISDPADGEVEWIELYNTTNQEINLTGWKIKEGSGAETSLLGIMTGSGSGKFIIIEKPKGYLNNQGDVIILRDSSNSLIDQVAYGNWEDGNISNNAPAVNDPNSLARKFDGQNSYNNFNDFAVTITPTPGASNIITAQEEEKQEKINSEEASQYDYSNDIIISEIFPNPAGSDSEDEFIELFNKGERDVNLEGWALGDNGQRKYKLSAKKLGEVIIGPAGHFVVYRRESKIVLNNSSGDEVKLYQPLKSSFYQKVKYEKAIEGQSYAFSDEWVWSEVVTPGEINIIKTINYPPIINLDFPEKIFIGEPVIFDSSDTVDEEGDDLEFSWNFGDGIKLNLPSPQHTYFQAGNYVVKLTVSDGENAVEEERIVEVINHAGAMPLSILTTARSSAPVVIINEILPNPEGSDREGEWVELKNISEGRINLLNWKLDDIQGGSKPYQFNSDLWLGAGDFYAVDRIDSGLALNNSADAVRLFNNFDELIEEIEYEAAVEGEAYARGQNGKWFWTTVLTPGEENIIAVANSKKSNAISLVSGSGIKNTKKLLEPIITTLEKIKELESGDLVKVTGLVAVKPGILGSQYFYIVGSPGIQVYSYKKEFPELRIGDYIEVRGELAVSSGELRIKTKELADIKILEHREAPIPLELNSEKINEDSVGQLVSITGEVVEKKSSVIYLDDGMDEVIIYIKKTTGINTKSIKEGEIISVTGLVGRTKSSIRIMPRWPDDIIKKDVESHLDQGAGRVLGEVATSDEWSILERDKKLELFKYLLVIAGGLIAGLAGLLIREMNR